MSAIHLLFRLAIGLAVLVISMVGCEISDENSQSVDNSHPTVTYEESGGIGGGLIIRLVVTPDRKAVLSGWNSGSAVLTDEQYEGLLRAVDTVEPRVIDEMTCMDDVQYAVTVIGTDREGHLSVWGCALHDGERFRAERALISRLHELAARVLTNQ